MISYLDNIQLHTQGTDKAQSTLPQADKPTLNQLQSQQKKKEKKSEEPFPGYLLTPCGNQGALKSHVLQRQ